MQYHGTAFLLTQMQNIGHQAVDACDFQTKLDLDLDAFGRISTARQNLLKPPALQQGLPHIEQ